MNKFNKEDYYNVINSEEWKQKKTEIIEQRGLNCENCGRDLSRAELDLHHLDYENLGNESDEDLMLLCGECHNEKEQDLELFREKK